MGILIKYKLLSVFFTLFMAMWPSDSPEAVCCVPHQAVLSGVNTPAPGNISPDEVSQSLPLSRGLHHDPFFFEESEGNDEEFLIKEKARKVGDAGWLFTTPLFVRISKSISSLPPRAYRLYHVFFRRHILFRSLLI